MRSAIILLFVLFFCNLAIAAEPSGERPPSWAQPIKVEGVPNLHKLDDHLYRSAQPSSEGMKNLQKMGIKTIVNLRSFHSDRDEIGAVKLTYGHIYMKAWHPEEKEAVEFLKIVTNPENTPVLVHCLHGADRTGTMSALYRIAVQDWPKEQAIKEMSEGGFNFHPIFDNLLDWIEKLDIESIKREAGIGVTTPPTPVDQSFENKTTN